MKKQLLFITFLTGILFSCTPKPSVPAGEYLIEGKLTHVPDSIIIQLFENGRIKSNAFVARLTDGKFTFRDTVSVPRIVNIRGRDKSFPSTSLAVWVAPGKHIKIKGQDRLLKTWQIESDIPEQIEENGYRAYVAAEQAELMKHMAADNEWMYVIRYERNSTPEAIEQAKIKRDSIRKLTDSLRNIIEQKTIGYMKTAPVTPIWIEKMLSFSEFLAYGRHTPLKEELKELYNRLSEEQKQSRKGKLIDSYLNPLPVVGIGDDMADGELYDIEGNLRHLSELKGKYILLDFWSNTCGPCIASVPEMKEAEERYKNRLVIVGISDDDEKSWKASLKEHDLKGYQWNEMQGRRGSLALRYRVKGVPHYVLITPDGKIQDMWNGYGKGVLLAKLKANLHS